ncbi:hypothetical protein [Candidatus Gromoviella agglomerans]|uniref:hypothetical protein n=1 Tax=Candidatus Gromoviella agglomerans TaxID=2806609 RepID=UPI001E4B747C|nr:hypothetical protein [Candidatus Gromoviella agglomerans]UFX98266.1 hypothetical protein Gromo_00149 [Candidatus Gromoviella agglomerans]
MNHALNNIAIYKAKSNESIILPETAKFCTQEISYTADLFFSIEKKLSIIEKNSRKFKMIIHCSNDPSFTAHAIHIKDELKIKSNFFVCEKIKGNAINTTYVPMDNIVFLETQNGENLEINLKNQYSSLQIDGSIIRYIPIFIVNVLNFKIESTSNVIKWTMECIESDKNIPKFIKN